jgi:hypothetical protein
MSVTLLSLLFVFSISLIQTVVTDVSIDVAIVNDSVSPFCFWLHGYQTNTNVQNLLDSIENVYPNAKIVITSDHGSSFENERVRYNATVFMAEFRQNQFRAREPYNFVCQEYMRRLQRATLECEKHGAQWIVAMEEDCIVDHPAPSPPPFDAVYIEINQWGEIGHEVQGIRERLWPKTKSAKNSKVISLMQKYEHKFVEMGGWGMAGGTIYRIQPLLQGLDAFDFEGIGDMAFVQDMCMPQFVIWSNMTFGRWPEAFGTGHDQVYACAACLAETKHTCKCHRLNNQCVCDTNHSATCWSKRSCPQCPFLIHTSSTHDSDTNLFYCSAITND